MGSDAYTKLIYNQQLSHEHKCQLRHYMNYMTDDEISQLSQTL